MSAGEAPVSEPARADLDVALSSRSPGSSCSTSRAHQPRTEPAGARAPGARPVARGRRQPRRAGAARSQRASRERAARSVARDGLLQQRLALHLAAGVGEASPAGRCATLYSAASAPSSSMPDRERQAVRADQPAQPARGRP